MVLLVSNVLHFLIHTVSDLKASGLQCKCLYDMILILHIGQNTYFAYRSKDICFISHNLLFYISNSSPVDTQVCYPYTLITPWGYQTPDMDTKFNSARALSISKWLGYPFMFKCITHIYICVLPCSLHLISLIIIL